MGQTMINPICLLRNDAPRRVRWVALGAVSLALLSGAFSARAQETVCARVKIEIKQELTLERQAFDAEMKINNTTDTSVIESIKIEIKVTDEAGTPVAVSDDPNDTSAKFFVRLSNIQNIAAIDGTGVVNPKTTGVINWLLIPSPGAAGSSPFGKKYLVGATLKYRFGGEETVLTVSPDVITVKPLPLLSLDYFLPEDVLADDPLTAEIEPIVPFTLGVRVKNNGFAAAKNLQIDSAQPKIIENNQGLLINFALTGSYLNDAPAQKTLLLNFGDIAAGSSKMGRWIMETTLAGKFTEFTARFSHADELGGTLTSILQATNAHFLISDVRVDLPGRDMVRDFLAKDGDVIRIYESDGPDTEVTDRSGTATFTAGTGSNGNASYRLTFPATAGFVYVRLPDPYNGTKALGRIVRSDAKEMSVENVWLSKTRNPQTKQWEYWGNFFDANTTGVYDSEFQAPPPAARAPVVQFIPDRVTKETNQVSFLVEASSPDGRPVTLSAAPMPAGASFTQQAPDPAAPGLTRGVFDWTPAKGTAGDYLVSYTATDGILSAARSAHITVETDAPPPGPGTPTIDSPLSGAQVTSLQPTLSVLTSANTQDPTTHVQFEVYADEAMTQPVASALVVKAPAGAGNGAGSVVSPTTWQVPNDLRDNTHYWWRARGFDGSLYSAWVNGRFFANTFNDPPDAFNLTNPVPGAEVATITPELAWTNSIDKDGDAITYAITVYGDAALTQVATQAANLPQDPGGSGKWLVDTPLSNHATYYWRVVATDALGAQTATPARPFVVNTGNTAPTAPVLLSPALGGQSTNANTVLSIQNATDAENDLITYVFEIDTVNTFDSADKHTSGPVIQGSAGTSWTAANLVENKRYWWRVKAQDGRAESAWVVGDFLMNAANDAPPAPTVKNPGSGAWVANQQPTLEANAVKDPEDEVVSYQFEVYSDDALTRKVVEGTSTSGGWIVATPLADKTTHWWRVRALDPQNAASAWSAPAVLYVSTGTYQNPTIAVTTPSVPVVPDVVGSFKQVTIHWEGTDPNIEPTVALYYGTSKGDYVGNQIVDGLRQPSGAQSGSYVWDVTALAPGAYYVYAIIYDAKGVGRAYAPGAVVIPGATQTGNVVVTAGPLLLTTEAGGSAQFKVRLGSAPVADVVVPITSSNIRAGVASPTSLVFSPGNWSGDQTVTVTGQNDCSPFTLSSYQVLSGKAQAVDPNYIGLSGKPVSVTNVDNGDLTGTTNNPSIHICGLTIVSQRKLSLFKWEYTLTAQLTNSGAAISGVTAKLTKLPAGITAVSNTLTFGAVGQGETVKSSGTVTLRSILQIPPELFGIGLGFGWTVTVQP